MTVEKQWKKPEIPWAWKNTCSRHMTPLCPLAHPKVTSFCFRSCLETFYAQSCFISIWPFLFFLLLHVCHAIRYHSLSVHFNLVVFEMDCARIRMAEPVVTFSTRIVTMAMRERYETAGGQRLVDAFAKCRTIANRFTTFERHKNDTSSAAGPASFALPQQLYVNFRILLTLGRVVKMKKRWNDNIVRG